MVEIALHIAGGFLLFAAVGALCLAGDDARGRKLGAIGHGTVGMGDHHGRQIAGNDRIEKQAGDRVP